MDWTLEYVGNKPCAAPQGPLSQRSAMMAEEDARRVTRFGKIKPKNETERSHNEEIREIVAASVRQWQPEYDRISRDDERW